MTIETTLTAQGWDPRIVAQIAPVMQQAIDDAVRSMLSNVAPVSEATAALAGAMDTASRGDHRHPRLTSSHGDQVLAADGTLTITYARTFDKAPSVTPTPETIAGQGPVVLTYEHIKTGALWTGCKVTGLRAAPVTVSILGAVVNVFSTPAAGAKFSLLAVQSSL